MKLSSFNTYLTLIANIGVLAGILFLAVELRQNSDIARADSYREIVQDIADWRTELISDPALFEMFIEYTQGNLSGAPQVDRARIAFVVNNILGTLESAYYSREYGILSDIEWRRFEFSACNHFRSSQLNQFDLQRVTNEFNDYLADTCEVEP